MMDNVIEFPKNKECRWRQFTRRMRDKTFSIPKDSDIIGEVFHHLKISGLPFTKHTEGEEG